MQIFQGGENANIPTPDRGGLLPQWVEDQNLTSQLGRHYVGDDGWENATPQGWTEEGDVNAAANPDDAQSLKIHGTAIWGGNMTLDTEMDANTDPWFNVNAVS